MSKTGTPEANAAAKKPRFYITGGTLPSEARSYVRRQADHELLQALLDGDFCYVLTARQMGKSSLLTQTKLELEKRGRRVVRLDLQKIGFNVTVDQWYVGLLDQVGRALSLVAEIKAFRADHTDKPPHYRWSEALVHVVLAKIAEPIVIFVDEIDLVRSLKSFSAHEFLVGIREFYTSRDDNPALGRLSFCLLGVATPTDLIADTRITPFNVGRRILLNDFTLDEACPLTEGITGERDASALLKRAHYWSGGQPYLTQCLCDAVASDPQVRTDKDLDQLVREKFLSRSAQENDLNLAFVRDRLLNPRDSLRPRLTIYREVRRGRRVRYDDRSPAMAQVILSGAVVIDDEGYLRMKNPIYHELFSLAWIRQHLEFDYRAVLKRAALWLVGLGFVLLVPATYEAYRARDKAMALLTSANDAQVAAERDRDLATNEGKKALEATKRALDDQRLLNHRLREADNTTKNLNEAFFELVSDDVDDNRRRQDAYGLAMIRATLLSRGTELRKMYESSDKLPILNPALVPGKVLHAEPVTRLHFHGDDDALLIGGQQTLPADPFVENAKPSFETMWHSARMLQWRSTADMVTMPADIQQTKISPNGRWLIAPTADGSLSLLSTRNWQLMPMPYPKEFAEATKTSTFHFSADSGHVAQVMSGGAVVQWKLGDEGPQIEGSRPAPSDPSLSVRDVRLASDGRWIAIYVDGLFGAQATFWSARTRSDLRSIQLGELNIGSESMALSPDNRWLVTVDSGQLCFWPIHQWPEPSVRSKPEDFVELKPVIPGFKDFGRILIGFDDASTLVGVTKTDGESFSLAEGKVFELSSGRDVTKAKEGGESVRWVGPGRSRLMMELPDHRVRIVPFHDPDAPGITYTTEAPLAGSWVTQGTRFAIYQRQDYRVQVIDMLSGKPHGSTIPLAFRPERLAVPADGSLLIAFTADGAITAHKLATGKRLTADPQVVVERWDSESARGAQDENPVRIAAPHLLGAPQAWLALNKGGHLLQRDTAPSARWRFVPSLRGRVFLDVAWASPTEAWALDQGQLLHLKLTSGGEMKPDLANTKELAPNHMRRQADRFLANAVIEAAPGPAPKTALTDDRGGKIFVAPLRWTALMPSQGGVWLVGEAAFSESNANGSQVPTAHLLWHTDHLDDINMIVHGVWPLAAVTDGGLIVHAGLEHDSSEPGTLGLVRPGSTSIASLFDPATNQSPPKSWLGDLKTDDLPKSVLPPEDISSVAMSASRTHLALGAKKGALQLWQLRPQVELLFAIAATSKSKEQPNASSPPVDPFADTGTNEVESCDVSALSFSADGSILAVGSPLGVQLWQVISDPAGRRPPEVTAAEISAKTALSIERYHVTRYPPTRQQWESWRQLDLPAPPDHQVVHAWQHLAHDEHVLTHLAGVILPGTVAWKELPLRFPAWAAKAENQAALTSFVAEASRLGCLVPMLLAPGVEGSLPTKHLKSTVEQLPAPLRLSAIERLLKTHEGRLSPREEFDLRAFAIAERDRVTDLDEVKDPDQIKRLQDQVFADMEVAYALRKKLEAQKSVGAAKDTGEPLALPDLTDLDLTQDHPEAIKWLQRTALEADPLLDQVKQLRDAAGKLPRGAPERTHKFNYALKLAERASEIEPENELPVHLMALILLQQRQWSESTSTFAKALALPKVSARSRANLLANEAFLWFNRRDDLRDRIKAVELANQAVLADDSSAARYEHQRRAEVSPKTKVGLEMAESDYAWMAKNGSLSDDEYRERAGGLLALGRRKEAEQQMSEAAEKIGDLWNAHYTQADFWRNYAQSEADLSRAQSHFQRALTATEQIKSADEKERADGVSTIETWWARLMMTRTDYGAARTHLEAALKASPGLAEAQGKLGEVQRLVGNAKEAEQNLRASLKTKPDDWWYQVKLACLLAETGRESEAETILSEERWEDNRAASEWIRFLYIRGRYQEALDEARLLERVDARGAEPVNALVWQAVCLRALKDLKSARECLQRALRLETEVNVMPSRLRVAKIHARLGDHKAAMDWMDRHYDLFPASSLTFAEFAFCHAQKGGGGWDEQGSPDAAELNESLVDLGRAVMRGLRLVDIQEMEIELPKVLRDRAEFQALLSALQELPGSIARSRALQNWFRSLLSLVTGDAVHVTTVRKELQDAAAKNYEW